MARYLTRVVSTRKYTSTFPPTSIWTPLGTRKRSDLKRKRLKGRRREGERERNGTHAMYCINECMCI